MMNKILVLVALTFTFGCSDYQALQLKSEDISGAWVSKSVIDKSQYPDTQCQIYSKAKGNAETIYPTGFLISENRDISKISFDPNQKQLVKFGKVEAMGEIKHDPLSENKNLKMVSRLQDGSLNFWVQAEDGKMVNAADQSFFPVSNEKVDSLQKIIADCEAGN